MLVRLSTPPSHSPSHNPCKSLSPTSLVTVCTTYQRASFRSQVHHLQIAKMVVYSFYIFDRHSKHSLQSTSRDLNADSQQRNASTPASGPDRTAPSLHPGRRIGRSRLRALHPQAIPSLLTSGQHALVQPGSALKMMQSSYSERSSH